MWIKILVSKYELQLAYVLKNGQSFSWHKSGHNQWTSVLNGYLISLRQLEDGIEYQIHNKTDIQEEEVTSLLKEYFQLDLLNLQQQCKLWSEKDMHFSKINNLLPGVRMLRQDPVESVFSFICSSNNHIDRITKMVGNLAKNYGDYVGSYEGREYYSFPEIHKLTDDKVEKELRDLGFGYRAKYINKSAKKLIELGGKEWLLELRYLPYDKCKSEIMKLDGVGPKVADCICLTSLDKHSTIPVDTHVYQIAIRDYNFKGNPKKSVSKKDYVLVAEHFKLLFGPFAGWAHSVLFTADLKYFKKVN